MKYDTTGDVYVKLFQFFFILSGSSSIDSSLYKEKLKFHDKHTFASESFQFLQNVRYFLVSIKTLWTNIRHIKVLETQQRAKDKGDSNSFYYEPTSGFIKELRYILYEPIATTAKQTKSLSFVKEGFSLKACLAPDQVVAK
uniref:Uncharacterized protein n=1 Tax=Romanomermis culicivorax TaxID=13658 RepID=A0A915HWP5_ROMCU